MDIVKKHLSSKGFTLVELLVVIVIIAALSSLAFVGAGKARISAKRIETLDLIKRTELAINRFYADYQRYPNFNHGAAATDTSTISLIKDTTGDKSASFLQDLAGELDSLATPINYKAVNYFFTNEATDGSDSGNNAVQVNGLSRSDTGDIEALQDAFGNPIQVRLDYNYDGVCTPPTAYSTVAKVSSASIRKTAVIWSGGYDNTEFTNDDVVSW